MKFRQTATFAAFARASGIAGVACVACVAFVGSPSAAFADDDTGCATLVGPAAANTDASAPPAQPQGFTVRDGEPVDYVSGGKTVHGKLMVFGENGVYRAYWQAENGTEKYVLANAGVNAVRLVSTPTQGTPAKNGQPGITLAPQTVLSCPAL